VELRVSVPEQLTANADRDRLRQAVANLVDNAIKYTPRGGRVDVSASRDDRAVMISVADTGPGISEPDLPRIFDRLYRGDQSRTTRGLGLGLSLVRAYVEAQGGTVSVESKRGSGTTFTIRLP
jgi:signal transduction histidine kinase